MIAILYVGVLMVQVALPAGHPLRESTGGSAGEWLALGGLAAAVWLYTRGLRSVKSRIRPENQPKETPNTSSTELERNARHNPVDR